MQNYNFKFKIVILLLFLSLLGWFLWGVFSGRLILPQLFHLGPFTVHYYGIVMALAVLVGFYFAEKRANQFGLDEDTRGNLLVFVVVGGLIGARLYHVLSLFGYYQYHPWQIFKVWQGGLSIYGAVLGGLLAIAVARKVIKVGSNFFGLLDWLTPSLLLGQIIGRFGNLFNYEAFGYPTMLPWKMYVPVSFRPPAFESFNFFHPWFLYEQLGNAVIFFVLLKVFKKGPLGSLFFTYLLLYNVLRFFLEFLRTDSIFWGPFRLSALSSLILALAAVAYFIKQKVYGKNFKVP